MKDIDTKNIFLLKQEINKLLQEKPELRELQEKIDLELKKAGNNQINRCVIISQMMMESLKELNENLQELIKKATLSGLSKD